MKTLKFSLLISLLIYSLGINAQAFTLKTVAVECYSLPIAKLDDKYKTYSIEWAFPPTTNDLSRQLEGSGKWSLKKVAADENPDITMVVSVSNIRFADLIVDPVPANKELDFNRVKMNYTYHIEGVVKDNLKDEILLEINTDLTSVYEDHMTKSQDIALMTNNPSQRYEKLCRALAYNISGVFWSKMANDFLLYSNTDIEEVYVMDDSKYYQTYFYQYSIDPLVKFFSSVMVASKEFETFKELYDNYKAYNDELLEYYTSIDDPKADVILSKGYYNLAVFNLLFDHFDEMEEQLQKITDPSLAPKIDELRAKSKDIQRRLVINSKSNRYLD